MLPDLEHKPLYVAALPGDGGRDATKISISTPWLRTRRANFHDAHI